MEDNLDNFPFSINRIAFQHINNLYHYNYINLLSKSKAARTQGTPTNPPRYNNITSSIPKFKGSVYLRTLAETPRQCSRYQKTRNYTGPTRARVYNYRNNDNPSSTHGPAPSSIEAHYMYYIPARRVHTKARALPSGPLFARASIQCVCAHTTVPISHEYL